MGVLRASRGAQPPRGRPSGRLRLAGSAPLVARSAMTAWRLLCAILLIPWWGVRACQRLAKRLLLSARAWVLFLLGIIVLLVAYYAQSNQHTPFTTDAYVQAYVVQVAAQV